MNKEILNVLGVVLIISLFLTSIYSIFWIREETRQSGFEQSYFISATKINNKALVQAGRDMEYAQFTQNREKINVLISSLIRLDNQVIDNILSQAGVVQVDSTGKQIFPRILTTNQTQGEE